ncbi:MAG TPA: hypothetical protein VG406_22400, partial [Isosphaeraceae bacterium]|nr:hypothetical protein [Isosphaeraceae bacterium]
MSMVLKVVFASAATPAETADGAPPLIPHAIPAAEAAHDSGTRAEASFVSSDASDPADVATPSLFSRAASR